MADIALSGNETLAMTGDAHAGGTIGPFRVLQLLGEGGFGSVLEAEQARRTCSESNRFRVHLASWRSGVGSFLPQIPRLPCAVDPMHADQMQSRSTPGFWQLFMGRKSDLRK